jgi:hypothetical protein
MSDDKHEAGKIFALLQRLEKRRSPYALSIKEKVDQGALLNDLDHKFLKEVHTDMMRSEPMVAEHPEYQQLAAEMKRLYESILIQAADNERRQG